MVRDVSRDISKLDQLWSKFPNIPLVNVTTHWLVEYSVNWYKTENTREHRRVSWWRLSLKILVCSVQTKNPLDRKLQETEARLLWNNISTGSSCKFCANNVECTSSSSERRENFNFFCNQRFYCACYGSMQYPLSSIDCVVAEICLHFQHSQLAGL